MKRCGKPLTAIEYKDFRHRFLFESNKKSKKTKRMLQRRLCNNLRIIRRLVFEVTLTDTKTPKNDLKMSIHFIQ